MADIDDVSNELASIIGSEEIPSDIRQTQAFQVLEHIFKEQLISAQQAEKYTRKLSKLHDGILKTYKSEKDVLKQVQHLKEELNEQKEQLKKSGTQSFEDNASISNLKKDLLKIQSEVTLCNEREEAERSDIIALEKGKKELEEKVEAERKRKIEELQPVIQQLQAETAQMKEEILKQKTLAEKEIEERQKAFEKIDRLQKERYEQDIELAKLKQHYSKIKNDPEKYKKQAEVSKTAMKTLEVEYPSFLLLVLTYLKALRLETQYKELETEAQTQARKTKENYDQRMSLALQLENFRNAIAMKEKECNDLIKESEEYQHKTKIEQENKNRMEQQVKENHMAIRRLNEVYMAKEREVNNALKAVRRAKFVSEGSKKSLTESQNKIVEMKREVEKEELITKKQHSELEELRCDRDILVNNFLRQEDVEKGKAEQLKALIIENTELEEELNRLVQQEQALNREVLSLELDRSIRRNDALKSTNSFDKAREELKLKNLLILDLEKVYTDSDAHLKKYEGLYEIVKNERNKYANTLQQLQLLAAEFTDKMKILQHEIDILQNESTLKDKAIATEKGHYQAVCTERDAARGEINKASYQRQVKEDMVDQGIAEIKKLNAIIRSAESEMVIMRKRYEAELEQRNVTGAQLVRRNEELSLLYEQANTQETVLRNGDVELQKRKEEIRILKLHIDELSREIHVQRKLELVIPKLEHEQEELMKLLREKQLEAYQLSSELESPTNLKRWRSLEGEEANAEELADKIRKLEEKISDREEKLLLKETTLQEAGKIKQHLQDQINVYNQSAQKIAEKVNECTLKVQDMDRKIRSTLSQLALNGALVKKLEQEQNELTQVFQEGGQRLEQGKAPTVEAEREWDRQERIKAIKEADMQQQRTLQESLVYNKYGQLTMADARMNMYLPDDDLQIPKPYGLWSPFKPNDAGSNMRHIKKPKQRELEL